MAPSVLATCWAGQSDPIGGAARKIVVNDQVHLSEFRHSDKPALVHYLTDKDIYRTTHFPYPYTEADADEWLTLVSKITGQQGCPILFAIRNINDGLIGACGIEGMQVRQSHRGDIGYWLAKPYWGRGIMTDVVRCMCHHAFEEFGLGKICAHVFASNPASGRVLEKCGFQEEGYLRKHFVKGGAAIDVRLFGLLR